jgi:dUTP pyrophosphatase
MPLFLVPSYIKVELLDGGKLPSKANHNDAGFDLYATSDFDIKQGEVVKHPLNIKLELPIGTYGEITTKSGLGSKGILVYAGIIDEGYRGVVHVILTKLNEGPMSIKKGQKLAQMIIHPYHSADFQMIQVESVDTNTSRGSGGFGSSGAF